MLDSLEGMQVTRCAMIKTTWWAEKAGTRVFSYDENGNCVNDGKRLYEWDVQNRLVRVIVPNEGEVRFRYRADGMRVEKQVVGGLTTKYVYDGQTVIGEIRSDGTKRWYVLGAMGYVCRIDEGANGEILARDYFVYDGLGSCQALVSSNGVVVTKYDYDVYGSVRGQEGQRANNFKYVAQIGHSTDEETGLIYMRARYYDPEVGRFVSEDPGQHGMNWYRYVNGNPVNLIDSNGKNPVGYYFAMDKWFHACNALRALLHEFIPAALRATDILQVEEAWGRFMEEWGRFVGPMEGALGAAALLTDEIMAAIYSHLVFLGHLEFLGSLIQNIHAISITARAIGLQLTTLCIGYEIRIASWMRLLEE